METRRLACLFSLVVSFGALTACGGGDSDTVNGGTSSTTTTGTGAGGGTTTGTGTGGAGGGTGGGGTGGSASGTPIEAPAEQWTYVPFNDAFCADGSPTGIGVNLTDKSKNVVIYMMGGGACWDQLTCYTFKTAAHIEGGYGPAEFQQDAQSFLGLTMFDRNDPANPFKDDSFVFIPYCTGDVHSGNNVADYGGKLTHHVGYANFTAYLSRILPTFPDAARVVLSGSSAGGFGSGFNWGRTRDAFGKRVFLIDDSGPPLPAPYLSENLEQAWRNAWNLNAALPPDCPACLDDLYKLFDYYGPKYPTDRASLLSYKQDNVISTLFQINGAHVAQGLDALATDVFANHDNFKFFYVDGNSHVLLDDPSQTSQGGVVLTDWITQQVTDDPAWASVQ